MFEMHPAGGISAFSWNTHFSSCLPLQDLITARKAKHVAPIHLCSPHHLHPQNEQAPAVSHLSHCISVALIETPAACSPLFLHFVLGVCDQSKFLQRTQSVEHVQAPLGFSTTQVIAFKYELAACCGVKQGHQTSQEHRDRKFLGEMEPLL